MKLFSSMSLLFVVSTMFSEVVLWFRCVLVSIGRLIWVGLVMKIEIIVVYSMNVCSGGFVVMLCSLLSI